MRKVNPRKIRTISRTPQVAQNVPTDVKLTFISQVIQAAIPLFQNKNPTNPA